MKKGIIVFIILLVIIFLAFIGIRLNNKTIITKKNKDNDNFDEINIYEKNGCAYIYAYGNRLVDEYLDCNEHVPVTISNKKRLDNIVLFNVEYIDNIILFIIDKDGKIISKINDTAAEYNGNYDIKGNKIYLSSDLYGQDSVSMCYDDPNKIIEYVDVYEYKNNKISKIDTKASLTVSEAIEKQGMTCIK